MLNSCSGKRPRSVEGETEQHQIGSELSKETSIRIIMGGDKVGPACAPDIVSTGQRDAPTPNLSLVPIHPVHPPAFCPSAAGPDFQPEVYSEAADKAIIEM